MNPDNKYNLSIDGVDVELYLIALKNKIYKLLPLREEGLEWGKFLNSVLIEVSGFNELMLNKVVLISLVSKLEGLYRLEDFALYRRTIFECLNLVDDLR